SALWPTTWWLASMPVLCCTWTGASISISAMRAESLIVGVKDRVRPEMASVSPIAAGAGGEFQVRGQRFFQDGRPVVRFGEVKAPLIVGSDSYLMVRVPEDATVGELVVETGGEERDSYVCGIGIQIADSLHPVSSPAIDS